RRSRRPDLLHVARVKDELRIVLETDRLSTCRPRVPDRHRVRVHPLDEIDELEELEALTVALEQPPQMSVSDPFRAGHVNRCLDGEPSRETRENELIEAYDAKNRSRTAPKRNMSPAPANPLSVTAMSIATPRTGAPR